MRRASPRRQGQFQIVGRLAPSAPLATAIHAQHAQAIADLGARLGTDRVIRAMPTVAAAQCASTTALCVPDHLTAGDADFAHRLFASVGTVVRLPESLIDAATGACGSGVGFACLFMESLEKAMQFENRTARAFTSRTNNNTHLLNVDKFFESFPYFLKPEIMHPSVFGSKQMAGMINKAVCNSTGAQ